MIRAIAGILVLLVAGYVVWVIVLNLPGADLVTQGEGH